jgi:glyoxylase-like metal-dependent hydrolase (beta-lactamase superfamily II)
MTEIFPNVHRIDSVYQDRILTSYLLTGKHSLLIDSGFAFSPEQSIFPYLDQANLSIEQVTWLVITHASADHCGGNHVIKNYSPQTCIIAHVLDAESIASHSFFIANHIDFLRKAGISVAEVKPDDPDFLSMQGAETAVDWSVRGGEKLEIDLGWSVILLHTPGHTPGHLAVYDPKNRALFAGDALMGTGVPDILGKLVMPPHYFDVEWYKSTINSARQNDPETILATHYPPIQNGLVNDFLIASERFIFNFDEIIMNILRKANNPLHIRSIIDQARRNLGIPSAEYQYGLLVYAHLNRLVQHGKVILKTKKHSNLWQLSPSNY